MYNLTSRLILFIVLIGITSCTSKQNKTSKQSYEANWESLKSYEIPSWFSDAKFGIFIHWGPYSVPAYGSEWYPRNMYMDSVQRHQKDGHITKNEPHPISIYHQKTYGKLNEFGYKDFIPMFRAEKFNAKEWVSLFKKAGAKYVIPVAEHHDGFAMYNSNYTKWNSVNMGPKRDVIGEMKTAIHEAGLYFGVSSHFAFNWNYYTQNPKYDTGSGAYTDLYAPLHEQYTPCSAEFLDLWWNRTTDIIDNYQPDILWFDFYIDREEFLPYHPKIAAYYYNHGLERNTDVVLQTKNFNLESFPAGSNVLDIERGKLADIRKYPWQTDTSVGKNSWCYVTNWKSRTAKSLIDDLIDIVSKNGNLLLNVGPKADGTIPTDQQNVLLDMGKWLNINGEAIYETKPWKIFGEGPTQVKTGHHTEAKNEDFTADDFRFTAKENTVYVFGLLWPEDDKLTVPAFSPSRGLLEQEIDSVELLGLKGDLDWKLTDKGLIVNLIGDGNGNAYTVKVSLK